MKKSRKSTCPTYATVKSELRLKSVLLFLSAFRETLPCDILLIVLDLANTLSAAFDLALMAKWDIRWHDAYELSGLGQCCAHLHTRVGHDLDPLGGYVLAPTVLPILLPEGYRSLNKQTKFFAFRVKVVSLPKDGFMCAGIGYSPDGPFHRFQGAFPANHGAHMFRLQPATPLRPHLTLSPQMDQINQVYSVFTSSGMFFQHHSTGYYVRTKKWREGDVIEICFRGGIETDGSELSCTLFSRVEGHEYDGTYYTPSSKNLNDTRYASANNSKKNWKKKGSQPKWTRETSLLKRLFMNMDFSDPGSESLNFIPMIAIQGVGGAMKLLSWEFRDYPEQESSSVIQALEQFLE